MSSKALYESIYKSNRENIAQGDIIIDTRLCDQENDSRLGISLIIPIRSIRKKYEEFIYSLHTAGQNQYFYPVGDLHVTVFDFIKAAGEYRQDTALEKQFLKTAAAVIAEHGAGTFRIDFTGIVFTREAGIIKGYDNDRLVSIRNAIRSLMIAQHIQNDERYESGSAHITFCRYTSRLADPPAFLDFVDKNAGYEFGTESVDRFELVEHDWYNLEKKKRIIREIRLADI